MNGSVNPEIGFETMSGTNVVLSLFVIIFTFLFLMRETRFQGLSYRDWFFHLPESMHFAIAVLVFNVGFFMRDLLAWIWRRVYDGGDIPMWMVGLFFVAWILIVVGMLCKIRSMTAPFYGLRPWGIALSAMVIFIVVSLIFR